MQCDGTAQRDSRSVLDVAADLQLSFTAGLCVCAARLLRIDYASLNAARAAQQSGASDVTCAMLCRRMWENDNCASVPALLHAGLDADADGSAQRVGTYNAAASRRYKLPAVPPSRALELLWARFEVAFRDAGGLDVVAPPGVRGFGGRADVDWVARGVRMKESDVQRARGQWRHFVAHMPPYPEKLFRGRGIITTGGGVKYMVPLLVSIRIVRATGCTLPIEAWFFASEMPAPRLAAELAALGVAVRNVDEIRPGASKDVFKNGDRGFGFVMKAAVLLFSGCEECLYLDSDNAVLTDPEQLFRESGYVDTGLVVWPDYWPPSVAPDMFRIAPEARPPPTSTVESGQVLFHKRTTWQALMLALFMNCQGSLYYNLLTNYMGMGDKETLPMAMRMLQLPYHDVGHAWPTGSAGLMAQRESHDSLGTRLHERTLEFRSNTMVQYHPSTGALLLLHGNLAKWDLGVPTTWGNYTRRWQVITPAGWRVTDTITAGGDGGGSLADTLQSRLEPGYHVLDPERVAWEELTRLRCAPWLNEYLQSLAAPGDVEHVYDNAPTPNGYHFMLLVEHASGKYLPAWGGDDGEETHTGGQNRLRV